MKTILFIIIIIGVLSSPVFADSGYIEPCSKSPYSLFYSYSTDKIYIGCAGDESSLELCVIDPITLNVDKTFLLDGLIESVVPINGGNSLLILLSDIDGDASTEDGELRQIAYSDGATEYSFSFLTIPLALTVDNQEDFAYVSSGLDTHAINPTISKIDLNSWQRALDDVIYGFYSIDMELTGNDSKLYIKNMSVNLSGNDYYYEIGIYNTLDMSEQPSIQLDVCPSFLKMGYDNRLYASHPTPELNQPSLLVIDTTTDMYTPLMFDYLGFEYLTLDSINKMLYCSILTEQLDPELEELLFMPTNIIFSIDLENQYLHSIIEMAPEPIIQIEVVPINDPNISCRLFGIPVNGNRIYYYDIY